MAALAADSQPQSAESCESTLRLKNLLLLAGLRILESKNCLSALLPGRKRGSQDQLSKLTKEDLRGLSVRLSEWVERFLPGNEFDSPPATGLIESNLELVFASDLSPLWRNENSLGYIYQCFSDSKRKTAQTQIQTSNKHIELEDLIAFTQIYTPTWVVRFLLESTVFPLLEPSKNGSMISLEQLKLIDPACGSGHFLLEAFRMLNAKMLIAGWSRRDATKHLVTRTIAGVDIDAIAIWITALALSLQVLENDSDADYRFENLASAAGSETQETALLGSLSRHWPQAHPLSSNYHVLVTNPPYIGRKLMSRELKALLKEHYPDSYHDLCTAFLRRSAELMIDGGNVGFITQSSMMYLPSHEGLRRQLIGASKERGPSLNLTLAVEAGSGVFPLQGGEKVNSVLIVAAASTRGSEVAQDESSTFIDLTSASDKESALREATIPATNARTVYHKSLRKFSSQLRYAFHYSAPDSILDLLLNCSKLDETAELKQGLATTDNNRFLRLWWEVAPSSFGTRWVPYVKGAGAERWYAPLKHVVNWQDNGAEIKQAVQAAYPYLNGKTAWVVKNESFYFREGLSFSLVNGGRMAVRYLPAGCIFDVAASSIFPKNAKAKLPMLAYLNSSVISAIASLINPTINFQVGDLKRLPIVKLTNSEIKSLEETASRCIELKKTLYSYGCLEQLYAPDLVQAAIDGACLDKLLSQFNARTNTLGSTILDLEGEANEIVLSAIGQSVVISPNDLTEIKSWVDRKVGKQEPSGEVTRKRFAEIMVTQLLAHSLFMSFPAKESPEVERLLVLNFNDRTQVADALKLTQSNLTALEQVLQKPVSDYLRFDFTRILAKECNGVPPIIALEGAQPGDGVISTLQGIHRLASGDKSLEIKSFSGNITASLVQCLLKPAIDCLRRDPDTPGKVLWHSLSTPSRQIQLASRFD